MDSLQPSTPSEEHGQTGSLRRYTQTLGGMEGEGSPTESLKPETPYTFTQLASPEFYDDANTHKASPEGSRDDSEQRGSMFPIFTDVEGDGTFTLGPENRENIAPKQQKLTITFTLGPDTFFTHTLFIYSDKESRRRVALPGSGGDITFDWRIRYVERARTDWLPPSRQPLAPLRGIRRRHRRPSPKMRRPASVQNDGPSAAETEAQEMSRVGGL